MILTEENYLEHYGILRKSGRYPWGSGETQSIRNKSFLDCVNNLKNKGMSDTDIAAGFGIKLKDLRELKTVALTQQRLEKVRQAERLSDKGWSNSAIGRRMGIPESSVRALLAPGVKDKLLIIENTASMLKEQIAKKKYIDVGSGVENHVGVPRGKLDASIALLKEQGYTIHYVKIPQVGTDQFTTAKILAKPGTPYSEVFRNRDQINQITSYSEDGGRTHLGIQPPVSVSSNRIKVNYAEDGGGKADGVLYIRPGIKDLSLGAANYAQVRIAVDGTHYLKGMAMHKDDLPQGVDIVFNTNKSSTGNKHDAMKEMVRDQTGKIDPDNPFGSWIKRQSGALNIVNEEGDWDNWSKTLSSQILSKQSPLLAKTQLQMTQERRQRELDEIMRLTNPVIKRKLLTTFADSADSAAVHLKAAHLPRQATKIILPLNSIKPNEIYAPSFRDGEQVALIRYPHAGTFEIPELRVNNRNREARKILGTSAKDAVGIHHKVAEHLSGADFDGDFVLVIPNNKNLLKSTPPLEGLKGFDPKHYTIPEGSGIPHITKAAKQREMGRVSNLIADMTIRGANREELTRAVRHSMVVIDAEKHGLDYKASYRDNGIAQLKAKYQGIPTGAPVPSRAGASTLISRAGSRYHVRKRVPRPASEGGPIDPTTGRKVWKETGESFVNDQGKRTFKTSRSQRLAETHDAFDLSSGTDIENVYATHSNQLKGLANTARKELLAIKNVPVSRSAKTVYAPEVDSLNAKLNLAIRNRPLERQAQVIANTIVSQKRQAYPDMDVEDLGKIKSQALQEARNRMHAKVPPTTLTQREWEAIQAGAISTHKLTELINIADLDQIKQLATPRVAPKITATMRARARQMLSIGYTQAEVADHLGVSLSTLKTSINE